MKNFSFMAFSAGKVTTEGGEFKRYIGVAPVFVIATNPTKEELNAIYNNNSDKEPEYIGNQNVNGKDVPYARIDFIVKTDAEKADGIEITNKVSYFIRKEYRFNKDATKVQVIDKYGRTAWVTKEEAATNAIPQYANGPANLDKDYRPCYVGEEDLTNFIKTYLGIPSVQRYVDGKWVLVDNPAECEARLDGIDKFFAGDFKELKEIMSYQPHNKVKIMFGVRTADDGKQYTAVYTQMVLRNGVTDFSKLDKDLHEHKAAGAYVNTEFEAVPIHEYVVNATPVEDIPESAAPAGWFQS
jgi:hypothetical protein